MTARLELSADEFAALTRLVESFAPRLSRNELLSWVDVLLDEIRERERWALREVKDTPSRAAIS